jgi:hypothetical protein
MLILAMMSMVDLLNPMHKYREELIKYFLRMPGRLIERSRSGTLTVKASPARE